MRKRFARLGRGNVKERGQALVEFTLVVLVFLLFVFGILDMARLFQSWTDIQHAAREGARYAVTGRSTCVINGVTYSTRNECIKRTVWDSTTGMLGGGKGASDSTVAVAMQSWDYPTYAGPPAANSAGMPCDAMEVKVTYTHRFVSPLLQFAAPSGISIVGRQRMINEPFGVC
jgi:Flp pilus assembly protein TadG